MSNSTLKMKSKTPVVTGSSRFSLRLAPTLALAALIACCPLQTRADTIAFSVSGGGTGTFSGLTLGYAFTVSSPIHVTNLGFFDEANNGLNESHAVTIWTSTGTQLVQATIPSGTSGTLINGFRYASIAPLTLAAGTYTIAAFTSLFNSDFALFNTSITSASGLSYVGSRSSFSPAFPTGDVDNNPNSYFGPNFQFTTPTSAPDTGTTASLFGLSLMGLAFLRRKLC